MPGDVFVALRGEKTDGHLYVTDAFGRGAVVALVEQDLPIEALLIDLRSNVTQRSIKQWTLPVIIRVDNVLIALQEMAKWWRARLTSLRVIGITGSVGKSSTKELTAAVLQRDFVILKNEGNLNNEIGLPLTLLQLEEKHERAVLEMGMYAPGEIARLAELSQPVVGVITLVGPVHMERLGSIEAIAAAKAELVQALPADGVAILNADDPRVRRMKSRTSARSMTYGFAAGADVRGTNLVSRALDGMAFRLVTPAGEVEVSTPALGAHGVHNGLAAAAVGLAAGLDLDPIAAGLAAGWQAPHRDQIVRLPGLTILDDAYNASPSSMRAALELLASLPGRHVAVLGVMRELGDAHERGHREVGEVAARLADELIVVGDEAHGIADAAAPIMSNRIQVVADRDAALEALRDVLVPGDAVLVKASRGAELERLVDALAAEWPERAAGEALR